MANPLVTIIIPNYNESENLKRGVLSEIHDYLKDQDYIYEVIISDDGSTDDSPKIISDFASKHKNFSLLKNPHLGKAFALKSAVNRAKGKYVLLTDMDQSTPIKELEKLLKVAKNGSNVVIGSRGSFRKDAPLYRKLASLIFQIARRAILLPEIVDTQCGFKLLETKTINSIFSKMQIFNAKEEASGWKVTAYDVEMLYLAKKMGNDIKEVRVLWHDEDISSGKSRNFVKESYEMLLEILRVRVNDILGKYA